MSRGGHQTPVADTLLPPDSSFDESVASSLLGKRPKSTLHKAVFEDDDSTTDRYRDALAAANVVTHFEARAQELHGVSAALGLEEPVNEDEEEGTATLVVDDFSRVAQLRFGSVPFGERKSLQLTLENPSELGNARVKYEGYAVVRNDDVPEAPLTKTRFKCDLHVCVVDALKSMTLRVTFEPLAVDVGREVTVMLKFTVNDRFKLQCKATGSVTPHGTAQRLRESSEEDDGEHQIGGVKRRFDFSSLRVLAQKRMESGWAQAAVELYHSPDMDDIFFNLQDEIGNKGLLFRADRPVYADVGLQEELINLLNNYHPVWLCLGLHAVLGHQVMKEEKCSLRAIFTATTVKTSIRGKKMTSPDQKMPRVLRRIILKHLVKDSQVAKSYRSVKNLLTPLDGSTADRNDGGNAFRSTKRNINGREYFDSLTETFMLKFFMLVLFLDRAIEHKASKFAHFPCLFRIVATTNSKSTPSLTHRNNKSGDDDNVKVKNSQVFVTEFCRFFLASEGRIDKHLKQLGYALKHEQTALDEINLEIKNWETDLRDGVRLAKLMEALTAPVSPSSSQDGEIGPTPKGLSTYLRVPALSRLQKVHNVEICLHFLQDKCGSSVLDNIKSNGGKTDKKRRLSGRVRVSSSGFAGLRNKVDEKMVENLAKDIVNGHREKTLALLWKLISSFQLQSLVDAQTMKKEIGNVVKRMSFRAKEFYDLEQQKAPVAHSDEHECYGLLLEWCRAVCANYTVSQHFALVNERIKQLGEVPVLMPQQYNTKNPPEEKMPEAAGYSAMPQAIASSTPRQKYGANVGD
ncbi:hypothetical protein BBJ29_005821 [Phytophthora kernoviae]|uniref:Abnormal spindle-like microcephaly-associated protein ASH domain-containing protein n=1 Tax=Phytophthora kernoviae TaxID=325452 RepID=A0A3F2RPH8_9STRA|nr:hypothetical protein BBJ29_005821 [Phytophthora kernoviae]RLN61715.1 hypothetical protein BBP00_00005226 [Phytophthora kernoviae]